jgi:hypothetical protein
MEGRELWYDITSIVIGWRFKRRFHCSLPEVHAPNSAKLLAVVGWIFIVVGVAGEFVADSFLSRADGYVQKFDEILLADTTAKSNSAAADAISLANRFGGLHSFVVTQEGEIDREFEDFKEYANDENKRTEELVTELNRDREKLDKSRIDAVAAANEAKQALAAVNAARKWRTLDQDQQERIAAAMSAWTHIPGGTGVQQVAVFPINQLTESMSLANQIAFVLGSTPKGAGWSINRNRVNFGTEWVVLGVGILTSSNARGQAVAAALAAALNNEGIFANVLHPPRSGCEQTSVKNPDADAFCSQISVMVGDHP